MIERPTFSSRGIRYSAAAVAPDDNNDAIERNRCTDVRAFVLGQGRRDDNTALPHKNVDKQLEFLMKIMNVKSTSENA
jgi:hypothetical protein